MNENVKVVFGLIGGLALFLYGMNSIRLSRGWWKQEQT